MKPFYYTLFAIYLFASCNKQSNNTASHTISKDIQPTEIAIDMDSELTLPFDSLIELTSIVKLETTKDNLIGDISQILFTNEKMIIVDRETSKSISVYDTSGKLINKIGGLGQAPNEYAFLWQISLIPDKSILAITDMGSQKVKFFNLDGNFINAVNQPYWFESCEFIDNKKIAIHSSRGIGISSKDNCLPQLVVTDLEKNISYHDFESKETKSFNFTTLDPLRKFENKILYNPSYTDTIYQVESETLSPYYYLNIKNKKPFIVDDGTTSESFFEEMKNTSAFFGGDYVELQNYAVFEIDEHKINWQRFVIYSKKQNKSFYCNGSYYDTRLRFFVKTKFLYKEDLLVTYVSAEEILMYKDELYRLCKKEEIDKLIENLREDDNPVLFFYRIKI